MRFLNLILKRFLEVKRVINLEYVYIAPMFQHKHFKIEQEENFIHELLIYFDKSNTKLEQIYFASAYFNPPYSIWDQLTRLNCENFEFVTATKEVDIFINRLIASMEQNSRKMILLHFMKDFGMVSKSGYQKKESRQFILIDITEMHGHFTQSVNDI